MKHISNATGPQKLSSRLNESSIFNVPRVSKIDEKTIKKLFKEADDVLNVPLSKFILDGPKDKLDLTVNTQPAIFLISFSIFHVIKNEFNIDLHK